MRNDINASIRLTNGVEIPALGLGVWKVEDEGELRIAVKAALRAGYRHIDTAAVYGNEDMVGRAVEDFCDRKDIFITTKLWNTEHERAEAAFEKSLKNLRTDYVDLYLIHWPSPAVGNYVAAWKTLADLYKSGRARAVGVSNFHAGHIEKAADAAGFLPHMDQVERHPLFQQKDLEIYCRKNNIALTAYSPLGSGRLDQMAPKLQTLADKYGKTAAQIILRWQFQTGWVFIPKSVKPERISENAHIFDFELSGDDMDYIAALDCGTRFAHDADSAQF